MREARLKLVTYSCFYSCLLHGFIFLTEKTRIKTRADEKGKEILEFKSDPRERRKVLHQRQKGLFQAGFKLNIMTGSDVLLVVQNERERRFYGTGPLREEYLGGKLCGIGKEEFRDSDGGSCSNGAVVGPLEATPSPTTGQNNSDRVSAIVGIPRSRKRLNMSEGDIPEPVKKLLTDKPIPVVLEGDKPGHTNEVENA